MRTSIAVIIFSLLAAGCGGSLSQFKPGTRVSMQGEIDEILHRDVQDEKQLISVTSIGFRNGQGISLLGLQPGASKGKAVKISGEFWKNISGTDVFRLIQIAPLEEKKAEEKKAE